MTITTSLLLAMAVILMGYGFFHIGYMVGKRKYEPKKPQEQAEKKG